MSHTNLKLSIPNLGQIDEHPVESTEDNSTYTPNKDLLANQGAIEHDLSSPIVTQYLSNLTRPQTKLKKSFDINSAFKPTSGTREFLQGSSPLYIPQADKLGIGDDSIENTKSFLIDPDNSTNFPRTSSQQVSENINLGKSKTHNTDHNFTQLGFKDVLEFYDLQETRDFKDENELTELAKSTQLIDFNENLTKLIELNEGLDTCKTDSNPITSDQLTPNLSKKSIIPINSELGDSVGKNVSFEEVDDSRLNLYNENHEHECDLLLTIIHNFLHCIEDLINSYILPFITHRIYHYQQFVSHGERPKTRLISLYTMDINDGTNESPAKLQTRFFKLRDKLKIMDKMALPNKLTNSNGFEDDKNPQINVQSTDSQLTVKSSEQYTRPMINKHAVSNEATLQVNQNVAVLPKRVFYTNQDQENKHPINSYFPQQHLRPMDPSHTNSTSKVDNSTRNIPYSLNDAPSVVSLVNDPAYTHKLAPKISKDNESEAMRLSIQAIQLLRSTDELRTEIEDLENIKEKLQRKCVELESSLNQKSCDITHIKNESANQLKAMADKDIQISKLEKEGSEQRKSFSLKTMKLELEIEEKEKKQQDLITHIGILNQQNEVNIQKLDSTNKRIQNLEFETSRYKELLRAETKNKDRINEKIKKIESSYQQAFIHIMESNNNLYKLENDMRENELKRQINYIKSVTEDEFFTPKSVNDFSSILSSRLRI